MGTSGPVLLGLNNAASCPPTATSQETSPGLICGAQVGLPHAREAALTFTTGPGENFRMVEDIVLKSQGNSRQPPQTVGTQPPPQRADPLADSPLR